MKAWGRPLMLVGLMAVGISVVSGLVRSRSPSVGWFGIGLGAFVAGRLLDRR